MGAETRAGAWPSPITSEWIAAGALRLSQPRLDGGSLYWLERRAAEGGRQVLARAEPGSGSEPTEVAPDVRTRVHEYGGGDYLCERGALFFVDAGDPRIHHRANGRRGVLGSAEARYADLALAPDGRWLVAVEERPRGGGEPENRLVAFPLSGADAAEPVVVAGGHDFVSSPAFAPDGRRLAFLAWEHPHMPWTESAVWMAGWGPDGPEGAPRRVAGGPGESLFQPRFSPGGVLTFVSDRGGWWNLHQLRGDRAVSLCPRAAEFGVPQWALGQSCYDFADADTILCVFREGGRDRLARLDTGSGALRELALPLESVSGLRVEGRWACLVGASPTRAEAVYALDLVGDALHEVRSSLHPVPDSEWVSVPEALEFPTAGGRSAHAFFYPPRNPRVEADPGERPPLLVKVHGGPTAAASSGLELRTQYWTSRGFALVDVDYGGSTGYGRAYRDLLKGQWGVVDVDDAGHAALHLAREGRVDPARLAISGSSAGGYTVLCALAFRDVFHAGASHYGIGDLEALARDTHKFEKHYTDWLVGPYPEAKALYRARSPLHGAAGLSCPVIFFQGLDDPVVPPSQAEAMVAALAARGIPRAYVPFEGEQHGFRRAESIRTALDGERYFYSRVFGFDAERPEGVRIET